MRRHVAWRAAATLGVASLVPGGGSATAAPPAAPSPPVCVDDFGTDFNADGRLEVPVGLPSEDRGSVTGLETSRSVTRAAAGRPWSQEAGTPEAGDRYRDAATLSPLRGPGPC